ncbi:S66 peptidase family protein [Halobacillus faecis]|uniref:Putative murein peptide carboxypeptidase n=1 Tax=Halobacillus faecis TaxID=360184 RepID=A0A511WQC8_9BACI|nr:LD-carboxypeptidase [Halobacillus faecis]GEN52473.1 putative murein peptide carboxypeptidase [Halobacillus faecis]
MIKPKRLNQGDTVGVIAPASPPDLKNLDKGLSFLESLGLKVKLGVHVKKKHGYLAGNDEERMEDFHQMFQDSEVAAIFCAGGGYGTGRILSTIDYATVKANPKIFWGYSDITSLHTAIRQETGLVTFHGPMLCSDVGKEDFDEESKKMFQQLFQPEVVHYDERLSPLEVIGEGEASGEVVGGNLSLLVNTMGTPYEIDTKGKLLFIEDVGEQPYRLDSFFNQLKLAGKLEDAAGIILGDFSGTETEKTKETLSLAQVYEDYFSRLKKPVLAGFKIGHCLPHYSIPFGTDAVLSSHKKSLMIQPGVY